MCKFIVSIIIWFPVEYETIKYYDKVSEMLRCVIILLFIINSHIIIKLIFNFNNYIVLPANGIKFEY